MLGGMLVGFCQLISSGFAAAKVSETEVDCCTSKVDLHGLKQYSFQSSHKKCSLQQDSFPVVIEVFRLQPFQSLQWKCSSSKNSFPMDIPFHNKTASEMHVAPQIFSFGIMGGTRVAICCQKLPKVAISYHNEIPVQCPPNVLKFETALVILNI